MKIKLNMCSNGHPLKTWGIGILGYSPNGGLSPMPHMIQDINAYISTNKQIEKVFPIPERHKDKLPTYCRILRDGSKAFYYDHKYKFMYESLKEVKM
jgi:hypothetical protein